MNLATSSRKNLIISNLFQENAWSEPTFDRYTKNILHYLI